MALNYKKGTQTVSAISADNTGASIDLTGYSKVGISTVFATCTGQASNVGTLKLQTSNDNSNWHNLRTIASEDDHSDLSTDTFWDYIPDHFQTYSQGVLELAGFGRYIRFVFAASNYTGGTVSYSVHYIAKE